MKYRTVNLSEIRDNNLILSPSYYINGHSEEDVDMKEKKPSAKKDEEQDKEK